MHLEQLEKLRENIDQIDQHIIELLAQRKNCVIAIHHEKQKQKLHAHQPTREHAMIESRKGYATSKGLDSLFIEQLRVFIHKQSVHLENNM